MPSVERTIDSWHEAPSVILLTTTTRVICSFELSARALQPHASHRSLAHFDEVGGQLARCDEIAWEMSREEERLERWSRQCAERRSSRTSGPAQSGGGAGTEGRRGGANLTQLSDGEEARGSVHVQRAWLSSRMVSSRSRRTGEPRGGAQQDTVSHDRCRSCRRTTDHLSLYSVDGTASERTSLPDAGAPGPAAERSVIPLAEVDEVSAHPQSHGAASVDEPRGSRRRGSSGTEWDSPASWRRIAFA